MSYDEGIFSGLDIKTAIPSTFETIKSNQLDRRAIKKKALAHIIEAQIDVRLFDMRRDKQEEECNRRKAEQQAEYQAKYEAEQAAEQRRLAEEERQDLEEYFREVNASTQVNVEKALSEIRKTETEKAESSDSLLFRGKPIKWIVGFKPYNKKVIDPFDGTIVIEERRKQAHLISYEGKEYGREDFLEKYFKGYKQYKCNVKFKDDSVFWLGSSQRVKLAYQILAGHFPLQDVAEQDKRDLEQLAANNQEKTYQVWRDRMKWEQGHEKMITFGAALDVRKRMPNGNYTSAANGVYCYESEITADYAKYTGIPMSWEQWSGEIKRLLDLGRFTMYRFARSELREEYKRVWTQTMRMATKALYHQNGVYLTLPKKEMDTIEEWIKAYFKSGKRPFPYKGDIPNADISFTIDFAADVEIVGSFSGVGESNKRRGKDIAAIHADELPDGELQRQEIIRLLGKGGKGKFDRMAAHGEIVKVKGRYGYWQREKI